MWSLIKKLIPRRQTTIQINVNLPAGLPPIDPDELRRSLEGAHVQEMGRVAAAVLGPSGRRHHDDRGLQ